MQKLVFTNGNGVEVDLTDFEKYGVTEWSGLSNTTLNIQTQQVPFNDGSVFLDALLNDRTISVKIAINDGGDLATRYELKRELIALLNPKLGEGVLTYTNDYLSKQITVIPNQPIFANKNVDTQGTLKADISFTACNPYWEDTEETEIVISDSEWAKVVNNGDIPLQVKAEIYPNNNGSITIENRSNDKELIIAGNISAPLNLNMNVGEKTLKKEILKLSKSFFRGLELIPPEWKGKLYNIQAKSLFVSEDGFTWEFVKEFDYVLSSICATETHLVIYTDNHKMVFYTEDLINWNNVTFSGYNMAGYFLIYNKDEQKVLLLSDHYLLYTTDLENWSSISLTGYVRSESRYVVQDRNVPIPTVQGATYICMYIADNNTLYGVRNDNSIDLVYESRVAQFYYDDDLNLYLLGGADGWKYSEDLVTWNNAVYERQISGKIIKYRNVLYLFGNHREYLMTTDGKNWATINWQPDYYANTIANYKGDLIICCSKQYWSYKRGVFNLRLGVDGQLTLTTFVETDDFIMTYTNGVKYKSVDGKTWESFAFGDSNIKFLGYINNVIMQGGQDGKLYYSRDNLATSKVLQVVDEECDILACAYSKARGIYLISASNKFFYKSEQLETATFETYFGEYITYKIIIVPVSETKEIYFLVAREGDNIVLVSLQWNRGGMYLRYLAQTVDAYSENAYIDGWYDELHDTVVVQVKNKLYYYIKASQAIFINFIQVEGDFFSRVYYKYGRGFYAVMTENSKYYLSYSNDGVHWAKLKEVMTLQGCSYSFLNKSFIACFAGYTCYFNWQFNAEENSINHLSEFDLKLDVGDNELTIIPENNSVFARLTYRNRYIGV